MLPTYESFLDATPERGVLIVEYYWQPKTPTPVLRESTQPFDSHIVDSRSNPSPASWGGERDVRVGTKTSMVFFKRILAAEKCWCGSKRQFSRCHRRSDDWSYVTLDPDHNAYSPVVLLERAYPRHDRARVREELQANSELLTIESSDSHAAWGLPTVPPILNEIGELILGTLEIEPRGVHLETNSEKRFAYLIMQIEAMFAAELGPGETRRAEPQKAFPIPARRRR